MAYNRDGIGELADTSNTDWSVILEDPERERMVRIQFSTDEDRIKGNYVLATNTVVRRLRGGIFELAARDLKLLDERQIAYTVLPIPEPTEADAAVRAPLAAELERRLGSRAREV